MRGAQGLPRLERAAINAWLIRLFDQLDEQNLAWIAPLQRACEQTLGEVLVDLTPSYTSLLVEFDPRRAAPEQVHQQLSQLLSQLQPDDAEQVQREHQLPVWYDPSVGPDLLALEERLGQSWTDIVALHAGHPYRVFALGFAPGFAFMGSVPLALRQPRLRTPRKRVAAGSVAIAEQQTAIYPRETPGGWHLLGRTPSCLFDLHRQPPSLFQVGDRVVIEPIDRATFLRLGGNISAQEV
ncbi:allophanate hydrolase subunit 1 [Marinospirillum sp. MEB164]|uniref:Allophanate hydrolase subunit 1 n=1 Tax=Marinospirillum alkalitolerans TaxID=3123374 RepID=A0ABW8PWA0_9GAMM